MGRAVSNQWSMQAVPTMDAEQFALWQNLLETRTGIVMVESRRPFLENSLFSRMRQLGLTDYADYLQLLISGDSRTRLMEWSAVVDLLTVQETRFFRHASSFELVKTFVQQYAFNAPAGRQLNAWSVGCSTGEEPYSLAMILDQQLHAGPKGHQFNVTATDISLPALYTARQGDYSAARLADVDSAFRARYFKPSEAPGMFRVAPALRDRVAFARINVLELGDAPMADMDVIFCQNMLIYFRRWRKRDIVGHLVDRLAPGGLLVLGLGEITDWQESRVSRVTVPDTLAFRRK